jgi:hypothetical protein
MKEDEIIYLMETLGFVMDREGNNVAYWRNFTKQIDKDLISEVSFSETGCYIKIFGLGDYNYYLSNDYDGKEDIGERITILFKSKNNDIIKHMEYFSKVVIENINQIRTIFFSEENSLRDWIITDDDIILIIPTYPYSSDCSVRFASYISLKNGFVHIKN